MTAQQQDTLARLGRIVSERAQPAPYNAAAVQREIERDKRIGRREAAMIHALLKGRTR